MSLLIYFCNGQILEQFIIIKPHLTDLRLAVLGSAKAQGVIGMVTGAGPGAMPQGGGWHVDAGPGRSEDISPSFTYLLTLCVHVLF